LLTLVLDVGISYIYGEYWVSICDSNIVSRGIITLKRELLKEYREKMHQRSQFILTKFIKIWIRVNSYIKINIHALSKVKSLTF